MPTYQYACTSCGHRFEQVQSFSDPSLTECPQCAGLLRKVFSSVGIVFKGSGFYRTDSRSGSAVASEHKTEVKSSEGGDSSGGSTKSAESTPSTSSPAAGKPASSTSGSSPTSSTAAAS